MSRLLALSTPARVHAIYLGTLERLAAAVVLFGGSVVQMGGVADAAVSGAVAAASPRVVSPAR